jgi:formylmethanofuran dehydrogenase subunit E
MNIKQNVNQCSKCGEQNLPEPIVFAQLCRQTNKPVCKGCYSNTAGWFSTLKKAIEEIK